jgi:hypothetical protein
VIRASDDLLLAQNGIIAKRDDLLILNYTNGQEATRVSLSHKENKIKAGDGITLDTVNNADGSTSTRVNVSSEAQKGYGRYYIKGSENYTGIEEFINSQINTPEDNGVFSLMRNQNGELTLDTFGEPYGKYLITVSTKIIDLEEYNIDSSSYFSGVLEQPLRYLEHNLGSYRGDEVTDRTQRGAFIPFSTTFIYTPDSIDDSFKINIFSNQIMFKASDMFIHIQEL